MRAWLVMAAAVATVACGPSEVDQAIKRYDTAVEADDPAEQVRQAEQVAAAYLQAGDASAFNEWKIRAAAARTASSVRAMAPADSLDVDDAVSVGNLTPGSAAENERSGAEIGRGQYRGE
jgi:hypothetical protein